MAMASLHLIRDIPKHSLGWDVLPIIAEETVIGRDPSSYVYLPAIYVARQEARIIREGESYYLENLNGLNATWLNDRYRMRGCGRQQLRDADRIRVGDYLFEFRISSQHAGDGSQA